MSSKISMKIWWNFCFCTWKLCQR